MNLIERSFARQLTELAVGITADWQPAAPHAGFIRWASTRTGVSIDLPPDGLDTIDDNRWTEGPILARAGYLLPEGLDHDLRARWLDGIRRLTDRDPAPLDRNSFLYRPVELLGLAVGAAAIADTDPTPAAWLAQVINDNPVALSRPHTSAVVLNLLAVAQLDNDWTPDRCPEPATLVDLGTLILLDLIAPDSLPVLTHDKEAGLQHRFLIQAATNGSASDPIGRAIIYVALHHTVHAATLAMNIDGSRPAEAVVHLCRRFPLLTAGLQRRHAGREPVAIRDEYDVQDLLGAILRLHFNDVRPEEWNPSYGAVSSRSDFLLKPQRLVIEVKMTRKKGLGTRDIITQLTVDKAQYRQHPDCSTLICFVYDPEHRIDNPTALVNDLSGSEDGLCTVIVVSPLPA